MSIDLKKKKIWVSGHNGMTGSALVKVLSQKGAEILTVSKQELDLRNQEATRKWIGDNKPELIFFASAKVGGIWANDNYPVDFLYDNLMMEVNVIEAAAKNDVEKLVFIGSGCIYPKFAEIPVKETSLMTGQLEPTNECYAIAKLAGVKLCEAYKKQYGKNFVSVLPTNLYGPGDSFHLENGHVVPSLLRKIHDAKTSNAKEVIIWGSGKPMRDVLHVDDCADALVHIMQNYNDNEVINVGSGKDLTILELATTIAKVVGWDGKFVFDTSKPDGTMRKLLDVTKLNELNWKPCYEFEEGIKLTYEWYLKNQNSLRGIS